MALIWTEDEKQKAIQRMIAACDSLIRLFEENDFQTFWIVAGMIRGGLEKLDFPEGQRLAELILSYSQTNESDQVCYLAEQVKMHLQPMVKSNG